MESECNVRGPNRLYPDVGDSQADSIEALVADHGAALLRFAYQLTHDRATAQDLVQDAFLLIHRRLQRRADHIDAPRAYLRRIITNEFVRRRRRHGPEILTDTIPDLGSDEPGLDETTADRDQLWSALGRLPERQRAVLVLRHYEQLTDAQIAAVLGCREATVRSLALRGLTRLRAHPALLDGAPRRYQNR